MTRTLTTRFIQVAVTTPVTATKAAPLVTPIVLGDVVLDALEVSLPGGSVGLMGFNLVLAQQVILPYGGNAGFIVRESADRVYPVGIEVDSGLALRTYNLDKHSHIAYFTFQIHDIDAGEAPPEVVPLLEV